MKLVWQTTNNNDMVDLADTVVSLYGDDFSISAEIERSLLLGSSGEAGQKPLATLLEGRKEDL